jgi:glycosyltransferase involved in cell wall biosynthesis
LGKPVIGARIGGIPELIREGETGLSFPSGDVAALVAAMQSIAAEPDARLAAMGQAGREWVEQEFTATRYREHILAIYAELGVEASRPQAVALPADVS